MKPTTLLLFVAMVVPAFAKDKPAPVYDRTGKVVRNWVAPREHDAESHMTVDGVTYDAYCDQSGNSISCSDRNTYVFQQIVLDNGKRVNLMSSQDFSSFDGKVDKWSYAGFEASEVLTFVVNMQLNDLFSKADPLKDGAVSVPFQYRIATVTKVSQFNIEDIKMGDQLVCVPFTALDKKGNAKTGETCYRIL